MEDKKHEQLIATAIQREQEAFDFYTRLRGLVADESVRETIDGIAEEEKKHKAFLEKYRNEDWAPSDLRMSDVTYYKIAEYQKEPDLKPDMKSEEVYLAASHRELRSHEFYTELAELHPDGETRELLLKVANEELKHKEKMEYLYANTAFPQTDGGRCEDFGNLVFAEASLLIAALRPVIRETPVRGDRFSAYDRSIPWCFYRPQEKFLDKAERGKRIVILRRAITQSKIFFLRSISAMPIRFPSPARRKYRFPEKFFG